MPPAKLHPEASSAATAEAGKEESQKKLREKKEALTAQIAKLKELSKEAPGLAKETEVLVVELDKTSSNSEDGERDVLLGKAAILETKIKNFILKTEWETKKQEAKEKRENLFKSLEDGLEYLKKELKTAPDKTPAERTLKEKMRWVIGAITGAQKNNTFDTKTGQFLVGAPGTKNSQKEGIPVNDLIEVLGVLQRKEASGVPVESKNDKELTGLKQLAEYLSKSRQKSQEIEPIYNFVLGKRVSTDFVIPDFLKPRPDLLSKFEIGLDKNYRNTKTAAHDLIEHLIKEANDKIINLEKTSTPKETEAATKITAIIQDLTAGSKSYFELHPEMRGDKQHWRTQLEAGLISQDYRKTNNESNDYKLAMETMSQRRELVLPTDEVPEPTYLSIPEIPVIEKPVTKKQHDAEEEPQPDKHQKQNPDKKPDDGPDEKDKPKRPEQLPKTKPDIKGLHININEIAKRYAERVATKKLNELQNAWRTPRDIPPPPPNQSKLGKVFGFLGRAVRGAGYAIADAAKHPVKFVKNVVVRNRYHGFYSDFYQDAYNRILKDQNLQSEIRASLGQHDRTKDVEITIEQEMTNRKVLEDVLAEYVQDAVDQEEKGDVLDRNSEAAQTLAKIYWEFSTSGKMTVKNKDGEDVEVDITDRKNFDLLINQKVNPLIENSGKKHGNDETTEDKNLFAHNFYEIALEQRSRIMEEVEKAIDRHGEQSREMILQHVRSLMHHDLTHNIQLGKKERDIYDSYPPKHRKWYDKMTNWLQGKSVFGIPIGSPVEFAVTAAVGTALILKAVGTGGLRLLGVAAPGIGALVGGTVSYARRRTELKVDKLNKTVDRALGMEAGGPISEELHKFIQGMEDLDKAVPLLESILSKEKNELTDLDKEFVANLWARRGLEKKLKTSLLSARKEMAEETGYRSLRELKLLLKQIEAKHGLNATTLSTQVATHAEAIVEQKEQKDKKFKRFHLKEGWKAALVGGAFGAVIGAATDFGVHKLFGTPERSFIGNLFMDRTPKGTALHEFTIPGTKIKMSVPDDFRIDRTGNELKFTDGSGKVLAEHVKLNPDNSLPPESLKQLRTAGISAQEVATTIPGEQLSGRFHSLPIDGHPGSSINLPEEFTLKPNSDGTITLIDTRDGSEIPGLQVDNSGAFTQPSKDLLQDLYGFEVNENQITNEQIFRGGQAREAFLKQNPGTADGEGWDGTRHRLHHNNIYRPTGERTSLHNPDLDLTNQSSPHHSFIPKGETSEQFVEDFRETSGGFWKMDKSGNLRIDFTNRVQDMLENGPVSADGKLLDDRFGPIAQLIKQTGGDPNQLSKYLSIGFYTDAESYRTGLGIHLKPNNGLFLDIPKGSPLYEQLVNPANGRPRLTIEYSVDIPNKSGGGGTHHVLATKRYDGTMEWKEPTTNTETLLNKISTPDIVDKRFDLTMPSGEDEIMPWFIPLPANRRKLPEDGIYPPLSDESLSESGSESGSSLNESGRKEKTKTKETATSKDIEKILDRDYKKLSQTEKEQRLAILQVLYRKMPDKDLFLIILNELSAWTSQNTDKKFTVDEKTRGIIYGLLGKTPSGKDEKTVAKIGAFLREKGQLSSASVKEKTKLQTLVIISYNILLTLR